MRRGQREALLHVTALSPLSLPSPVCAVVLVTLQKELKPRAFKAFIRVTQPGRGRDGV